MSLARACQGELEHVGARHGLLRFRLLRLAWACLGLFGLAWFGLTLLGHAWGRVGLLVFGLIC